MESPSGPRARIELAVVACVTIDERPGSMRVWSRDIQVDVHTTAFRAAVERSSLRRLTAVELFPALLTRKQWGPFRRHGRPFRVVVFVSHKQSIVYSPFDVNKILDIL